MATDFFVPEEEGLDRAGIERLQRTKLGAMWAEVMRGNVFYQRKFAGVRFDPARDAMEVLPLTVRGELEADQKGRPPFGTNLTYGMERYCRFHQTSGTGLSGRPLRWVDTREGWDWFKKIWGMIYSAAGVRAGERLFFPFSFGPFVGFWGAFDGGVMRGNMCIPAGGMTTAARLKLIVEMGVNVICCTPTYALRMLEVAREEGIEVKGKVRVLIVAGEPGGSVAEVRKRIEEGWGARVMDHTGMTEVGPLGFECWEHPDGVHLAENECIAEVVDAAGQVVRPDGNGVESGELVLTNLGRWGSPLIRYRTGDVVRLTRGVCECGRSFARMEGGIVGRMDDMVVVRGNNIFPAAIDGLLRSFAEVAEYQVVVYREAALTEMKIRVEVVEGAAGGEVAEWIGRRMQDTLNMRCAVEVAGSGELPRFEMKAKRWVREDRK